MTKPLQVGVAGLGTVGAALVNQIARQRETLVARCGRRIDVVAVCARSRAKKRGVDLKNVKWFSDPVSLARAPGIDVFVELIGGAGGPAKSAVEAALALGQIGGHRQQGIAGEARRETCGARREKSRGP